MTKNSTRKILRALGAGALLVSCASCNDARAEGAPLQTSVTLSTVTLSIEGMSCAACTIAVRIALKKLDGVRDTQVSFEEKRAVVQYQIGKVTPQQMVDAVNRLGYHASIAPSPS